MIEPSNMKAQFRDRNPESRPRSRECFHRAMEECNRGAKRRESSPSPPGESRTSEPRPLPGGYFRDVARISTRLFTSRFLD
jgi:hypothetical protein